MGYFPPSGVKASTRGQRKVRGGFLGLARAVQRLVDRVGTSDEVSRGAASWVRGAWGRAQAH